MKRVEGRVIQPQGIHSEGKDRDLRERGENEKRKPILNPETVRSLGGSLITTFDAQVGLVGGSVNCTATFCALGGGLRADGSKTFGRICELGDGDDDGLLLTQAKPKPPLPFQQITLHVEVERERERGREVVLSIRLLLLPEKVEMYFTEFFNSATEKPKLIGIWLKLYNRISDNYSRHQFSGMNLYLVI
ncbi:hypothetical protein AXG93_1449s1010 [Marchantia polymorpha subsp. ruderalis]|uniref:Uncharacterized protein n=1 Tax=Marchantia polymorpha subsp. ruderalis TaxID=1480154 RepID=A0A176VGT7_MARPO|nr:hypothetical protein AXG93_1449s1010 [Marchantia polymorpha subsp. ruderalis]